MTHQLFKITPILSILCFFPSLPSLLLPPFSLSLYLLLLLLLLPLLPSPPPLCGAIQADEKHKCKPDDQVAARVTTEDGEEEQWILAAVVSYNSHFHRYVVDDIDEEGHNEKRLVCCHLFVCILIHCLLQAISCQQTTGDSSSQLQG